MIGFFIFIGIILLVIAAIQLVKVLDLAAVLQGKGDDNEVTTERDNRTNGILYIVFMVIFFAFVIGLTMKYAEFQLPSPASEHGQGIDDMMHLNLVIISAVFFLTNILLFFFAFKYHGRKNSKATFYPHNNKLEMAWTIAPMIVLAGLITYGLTMWNRVMDANKYAEEDYLHIELYAKQFDWTARYAGVDGKFGKASFRLIEGTNALGLDVNDPAGSDDKVVKELHLPKGKPVKLSFRSRDVIHSAYLPHFRVQMNCVPGMTTQFAFTPSKTTAEMREDPYVINKYAKINQLRKQRGEAEDAEFNYILLCNKICGMAHNNMQMKVVVESEEEFNAWFAKQKAFGEQ
ncbi:MAG: cytochrome c oxidase subunit II [Flavobacteriales bacterium]|nr:cytochrome c oxidase subunit II [Flavobacteriales bacterium]